MVKLTRLVQKNYARHTFTHDDQIKFAFDMNKAHFFDVKNEKDIR